MLFVRSFINECQYSLKLFYLDKFLILILLIYI